jgi:hypothetical protein
MKSKAQERALQALEAVVLAVVVAAAVLGAGPTQAQRYGQCVRVELDAPVVLPDGSLQQVGLLRLCLDRKMNPAAGIHEIEADGVAQLALSRIGRAEADAAVGAVVVFERRGLGELRLIGYAVPDGDRLVTFTIGGPGQPGDALRARGDLLAQPGEGREKIIIAARESR